ncbi:MAG: chemotaxis response regulator protein-glutamate methylesterase [Alphaproteobacteria bacterium]|nr:chemotaxis response regulator protein-glutamate methylesterase [Alphaproteobacteria bacterium]
MLVDDSAVIRGALKRLMENVPHINVIKSLSDGNLAINAAERLKPHVVILDIEMPVMDGLTALPQILKASPDTKVIMFSSLTEKGAKVTMDAMRLGAVECIVKPSSSQDVGEGSAFQKQIISLIENLVPPQKRRVPENPTANSAAPAPAKKSVLSGPFTLINDPMAYKNKPSIVAIGSSTGGPQALFNVLKHCKGFDIPIVITQHMPATFTKILAEHIQQQIGVPAHEGANGMLVEAGKVYVAPGGFHMLFEKSSGALKIKLDEGPPVNFCKPAVDPMFESLIQAYGQRVLGVILTGMGQDGREGCKKLVEQHGRVIAQDEATSVVWGMPGAVAQANICTQVLPIDKIGPWIHSAVMN